MDTVTHGIAGALLGKGFFSKRQAQVAIFAATLGSVFPDSDVVADIVSRDPLGIIKYHRALTHSFIAMPFFAVLFAWLTPPAVDYLKRKYPRFQDLESPSRAMLIAIYCVGIASHIFLDGMTSFGTRMWYPLSNQRVAWDLLFIVDLSFTSLVLLPQIAAWICSDQARSRKRAVRMWLICSFVTLVWWALARAAGYPFHLWIVGAAAIGLAVLFFWPAKSGWGFRVTRAEWCQAGTVATIAYLFACALAHHAAMLKVRAFADQNHLVVDRMGALPIPPSLLDWGDAIRTPDGLYQSQFDLRKGNGIKFRCTPDSPPDEFIAHAFRMATVQLYWQFARFPSILSFPDEGNHVVELGENRFTDTRRGPQPFTYQVVFTPAGNVVGEGWLTEGMLRRRMRQMVPQPPLPPRTAPQGKSAP